MPFPSAEHTVGKAGRSGAGRPPNRRDGAPRVQKIVTRPASDRRVDSAAENNAAYARRYGCQRPAAERKPISALGHQSKHAAHTMLGGPIANITNDW